MNRLIYLGASIVFVASVLQARAQAPSDAVDPPDTQYGSGVEDIDPGLAATVPVRPTYRAFIPVSIDLSHRLPEPGNQGKANSCTAWAVAYAARGYYTATLEHRDIHLRKNIVSPTYVYTMTKQLQNKPACATGSNVYYAVEVLKKGALSLLEYPYHDSDCDAPPSPEVAARATDFRVQGLRFLDVKKIDDVKGALADSQPVIIEFHDSVGWHRLRGAGVFSSDSTYDATKDAWHAMTLVGYDERKQAFRLLNSWGTGWGDHGYAWLGYDAFTERVRRVTILDVAAPIPPAPRIVAAVPAPQPAPMPRPAEIEKLKPATVVPPPAPAPQPVQIEQPKTVEVAPQPPAPPPRVTPELGDLATLSCAKIDIRKDGGANVLGGFVGSESDLNLVKRVAQAVPNTSIGNVLLAPWPQCEAMETLAKALAGTDPPKIDIGPAHPRRAGEVLKIEIKSPPQISYLYVSYVQADGSVVHLVQPNGVVAQPTLPNQKLTFGDGREGRATFTVSPPFGREMIIAIASRSPLFDEELPAQQSERDYLTVLRKALIYKPSPNLPDRELSASIATLQTEPRTP